MCDLSYHHKVHSYAVCVWLTHIYEYDAHSSYHCEAHSQFHYECEAHSHLSYHCETHSYPWIWCSLLRYKYVWDSQLHNRLRDTHTHTHNSVTTMWFTHNYATGVRLTIIQWSKAHSIHIWVTTMRFTHSCAMCARLTHIYITSVSTQCYAMGVRLTRNYATGMRLTHNYATGVRLTYMYIKCVGPHIPLWGSFTVTVQVTCMAHSLLN